MADMGDSYSLMKATFRRFLNGDLTDAEIASRAPGRVGDDYCPYALFCWGEDERGEYVDCYKRSRWGDEDYRIRRDGSHAPVPGPFDEEYEALERELAAKGLLYNPCNL